jgi:hypothetical protein
MLPPPSPAEIQRRFGITIQSLETVIPLSIAPIIQTFSKVHPFLPYSSSCFIALFVLVLPYILLLYFELA